MLSNFFNRNIVIYYMFLLLVLVSWTNADSLPPFPLRLAYLVAVIVPLWKNKSPLSPFILFTFVVISGSLYAVSYMPVDGLYISIVLGLLCFSKKASYSRLKIPAAFIILTISTFAIDLINHGDAGLSLKLLAVIIASWFIPRSNEEILKFTTVSIIFISFVIALDFLVLGGKSTQTVSTIEGVIDRKGWADPNYFGAVLGYGVIASFIALQKWPHMQKKVKYAILMSLIFSLYVILTTASRGVFLAIVASVMILFFNGSLSIRKKLSFLFLLLSGVYVFYLFGFFNLLLLRFGSDAGDAGGRTLIWMPRLYAFFNECNLVEQLFGVGIINSRYLGTFKLLGSHNDYIATLTSYGYLGVLCLFSMLLYPFFRASVNRTFVSVSIIYMATCMFSIEPFTGGQWSIYYFYLFTLMLSQQRPNHL